MAINYQKLVDQDILTEFGKRIKTRNDDLYQSSTALADANHNGLMSKDQAKKLDSYSLAENIDIDDMFMELENKNE